MLSRIARVIDRASAWPGATVITFALVLIWLAYGPAEHFSNEWLNVAGAVSGVGPFFLVFAIQHSARRDTTAVQIKLDALLLAVAEADNRFIRAEHKPEAEIAAVHAEVIAEVDAHS